MFEVPVWRPRKLQVKLQIIFRVLFACFRFSSLNNISSNVVYFYYHKTLREFKLRWVRQDTLVQAQITNVWTIGKDVSYEKKRFSRLVFLSQESLVSDLFLPTRYSSVCCSEKHYFKVRMNWFMNPSLDKCKITNYNLWKNLNSFPWVETPDLVSEPVSITSLIITGHCTVCQIRWMLYQDRFAKLQICEIFRVAVTIGIKPQRLAEMG